MINLIVAMDKNRLIGNDNGLPWRMPADMAYFKDKIKDKTIIMGRKTAESIPGPLSSQENIILSRQSIAMKGFRVEHSVGAILEYYASTRNCFVIGGEMVYTAFLPYADRLYITRIDAEYEGDSWFPEHEEESYRLLSSEYHPADDRNPHAYCFEIYERK